MILAAASDGSSYLPYVVGVIVALLGSGAVVAFFRARPEGSKIIVDAAQGAVIVQSGVMEDLRKQLDEADKKIRALNELTEEVHGLRRQIRILEQHNEDLMRQNTALESRVHYLEEKGSMT